MNNEQTTRKPRDPAHTDKIIRKLTGVPANGRTAMGPENRLSLVGRLRDPDGRVHAFRNLMHFVREHHHLFHPDDVAWRPRKTPPAKYPDKARDSKVCNAYTGLARLNPSTKCQVGSWKGWTWIGDSERRQAVDTISRAHCATTNTQTT